MFVENMGTYWKRSEVCLDTCGVVALRVEVTKGMIEGRSACETFLHTSVLAPRRRDEMVPLRFPKQGN